MSTASKIRDHLSDFWSLYLVWTVAVLALMSILISGGCATHSALKNNQRTDTTIVETRADGTKVETRTVQTDGTIKYSGTTIKTEDLDKTAGLVEGYVEKYGGPVIGSVASMLGLGGVVGVARRHSQRRADEKWDANAERTRADEYAAGLQAGLLQAIAQRGPA